MKNIFFQTALVSSLSFACAQAPKSATTAMPSDLKGYQAWSSKEVSFPPLKSVTLDNGLRINFIYDATLPRVSFSLITFAGLNEEKPEQAGINALTAYTMSEGTQTRTAIQINEALGQLGTEIDINPSHEFTEFNLDTLSTTKQEALDIFADIILNPKFNDNDLNRIRKNLEASIKKRVDNPGAYASEQMQQWFMGSHPFARSLEGSLETLGKLKRQDLIKHYSAWYRPNNSVLSVVGKYDAEFENVVKTVFGSWVKREEVKTNNLSQLNYPKEKTKNVKKSNLKQSEIRMYLPGVPRRSPDTISLRLANEILGGSFSSRLNQKIRGQLGLTYSIYSGLQQGKDLGTIRISTFTKNETVDKLVVESKAVISEFWKNGITETELQLAKQLIIGQFPRVLETSDRIAYNIVVLDYFGVDPHSLTTYTTQVEKTTLKEVNEVIKRYFNPETLYLLTLTP
ncbi:MAG: M16 family metallopeptidase [Bdellovibrionia bacterium]